MTNAERIRSMKDEEMAERFKYVGCPPCYLWREDPHDCVTKRVKHFHRCSECWMDWLREEADNE